MSEFASNLPPYPPQQAGVHWVLPTIDTLEDGRLRLHVSIGVSSTEELQGSDLEVGVLAGGVTLNRLEGPPPDAPLAVIETAGLTAFGQFVFDNPEDSAPTEVTVTVRGESASFDVSQGVG